MITLEPSYPNSSSTPKSKGFCLMEEPTTEQTLEFLRMKTCGRTVNLVLTSINWWSGARWKLQLKEVLLIKIRSMRMMGYPNSHTLARYKYISLTHNRCMDIGNTGQSVSLYLSQPKSLLFCCSGNFTTWLLLQSPKWLLEYQPSHLSVERKRVNKHILPLVIFPPNHTWYFCLHTIGQNMVTR